MKLDVANREPASLGKTLRKQVITDQVSLCSRQLKNQGYTVFHTDSPELERLQDQASPRSFECDEIRIRESMKNVFSFLKGIDLTPVQYVDEGNGGLFVNICPTDHNKKSRSDLRGHTDGAFLYMPGEILPGWMPIPRYIALYCVKNSLVYTRVAHVKRISELLHKDHLKVLSEDNFRITPQDTWGVKALSDFWSWRPLIKKHQDDLYVRYSHSTVVSKSSVAEKVRKTLEHAIGKSYEDVLLRPGDVLVIDNLRTVHGRRGFADGNRLEDRWLIRFYCN